MAKKVYPDLRDTIYPSFEERTLTYDLAREQIALLEEQIPLLRKQDEYAKALRKSTFWTAVATAVIAIATALPFICSKTGTSKDAPPPSQQFPQDKRPQPALQPSPRSPHPASGAKSPSFDG